MAELATLTSVAYMPEASGLVGDHAVGATVLNVKSGRVFGDLGTFRLNGTDYKYLRDGDTLNVDAPGLVAAAEDGDPVERLNAAGVPEGRIVAFVSFDEEGDEDDEAEIPAGLRGYFPEGIAAAGTIVDVESTEFGYRILSRPFDPDFLDGFTTVRNRNVTLLKPSAVVSVSDSFDRILDNLQVIRSSDIAVRVETTAGPRLGTVYIDTPGIYLVTLTLSWAGSNVGHRRARIVQGGNSVFFPAIEVGEVRTTPVTGSNTIMQVTGVLYDTEISGGEFSVFVYQNSGASLNVSAASAVQIVKLG